MSKQPNDPALSQLSVADIEGPWSEPDFSSSLIDQCRMNWQTPICELSNGTLAMFIRQEIGLPAVADEARRRVAMGVSDDTELFDGELSDVLSRLRSD